MYKIPTASHTAAIPEHSNVLTMSILTHFTLLHDSRWRGAQRYHHIIFLFKSVIPTLSIVLVILH
jgi:hypothetical protein